MKKSITGIAEGAIRSGPVFNQPPSSDATAAQAKGINFYRQAGNDRAVSNKPATPVLKRDENALCAIAVGTLIAERPPHRTERAQFGHSAPTLGV